MVEVSKKPNERIIIGIDPGTSVTGYGIILVKNNQPSLLTMGVIDLSKLKDPFLKLQKIFREVLNLIDVYHPDEMAVEAPFYGKNVQSMLKLGRAQGVAISAALYRDVCVAEYLPRNIKQAVTGNGNATKEQVAAMLKSMLKLKEMPAKLDATDGLAAAVCHCFQKHVPARGNSSKSWKEFLSKNPGRIL